MVDTCWVDFRKVKADVVVDVDYFGEVMTLFFKFVDGDGLYRVSKFHGIIADHNEPPVAAKNIRISKQNQWVTHLGGECPIAKNCAVDVKYLNNDPSITSHGDGVHIDWSRSLIYKLKESDWQNRDGLLGVDKVVGEGDAPVNGSTISDSPMPMGLSEAQLRYLENLKSFTDVEFVLNEVSLILTPSEVDALDLAISEADATRGFLTGDTDTAALDEFDNTMGEALAAMRKIRLRQELRGVK